ncbi:MAG: uroporphyrinogen decarboxylase family protein [Eubacteriaceae bacterium]
MITKRQNYLMAARGEKPHWVPSFVEEANVFMPDFWEEVDPVTGTDFCNIKWIENDAGKMPDERWRAMETLDQWRETVKFPDLSSLDWEEMASRFKSMSEPDKVNIAMLNTNGIFLIPIDMIGWVDGLCAIYEEPEELEAFVSAITDFLVEIVKYMGEYIKPDIVFTGDDLAAANGPFVSKDIWDSMYKPYFKKIIDAIHDIGALAEFHCCGNCQFLIDEFIEVGADICQLPEPNESLLQMKEKHGNRLVLTGGWDRHSDAAFPGASEEIVRESVHQAIDVYGKNGGLIFWDGGIVGSSEDSKIKMAWVLDELNKYGKAVYQQ